MTRPGRTLLVLAVMSIGGVSVLAWMASQYEKKLSAPRATGAGAVHADLRDFLAVRREVARAILAAEGRTIDGPFVLRQRRRALERSSLSEERYVEIRESYRAWRTGRAASSDGWAAAFPSVRDELIAHDLGRYESLDP